MEHFLCFNTSSGNRTNGAEFKHKQQESREGGRVRARERVNNRERERERGDEGGAARERE